MGPAKRKDAGGPEAGPAGAPRVGVLALQGNFSAHARALATAGAEAREVRTPAELAGLDGLVLPGGESTALLRLMEPLRLADSLQDFHARGGVLFGTCAGLILLAREVRNPAQPSLGLLDVAVERNAYGRQIDSFVGRGVLTLPGQGEEPAEMVFIRAPRIRAVGPGVEVLGLHDGEPVLVGQGRILAATFHPELAGEDGRRAVHRHFLELVRTVRDGPRPGVG